MLESSGFYFSLLVALTTGRLRLMPSKPFSKLAKVYDLIFDEIEYDEWTEFTLETLRSLGQTLKPGASVLDLACGTGSSSLPYLRRGFQVSGVDLSSDMLEVARVKLPGVPLFAQGFTGLDLPDRFDLISCVFDSLNNLTDPSDLELAFKRVFAHLQLGAWFVFDMNTPLGVQELWDDDRFEGEVILEGDSIRFQWTHRYDPASELGLVTARFGRNLEHLEEHAERGYWPSDLEPMLKRAGFLRITFFEYPDASVPTLETPRVWCFAQKSK
jgi:ubiquinone/menaquinone biosynthesis C-methylase UbiE